MEPQLREILFKVYCPKCKHWNNGKMADPCWECLDNPAGKDSEKPVNFEEPE